MSDVPSDHCEAKLHGFRRTNDGVVVSFVLHPQEVPQALALDPLGTRYMLAFAQIGDDEKPIGAPDIASGDNAVTTAKQGRRFGESASSPRKFHTLPLSQQAALLCHDATFQIWAHNATDSRIVHDEWECAAFIREQCCDGNSRSLMDTNPEYARRFQAMVERFRREVGREAELR